VQADVHPPLYYFLVRAWLELPLPGEPLLRVRALSVLCTLAATVVFHRLWLASLDWTRQALFLGLWVLSPCLVLYSRMARSYTLQLLVAMVAIRCAGAWMGDRGNRKLEAAYAVSAAVLLYTHYLPGLALAAGVAGLAVWRRQWSLLRGLGWIALAYVPWMATLLQTAGFVASTPSYWLGANWAAENAVKLGYAFVAFQFGETMPLWAGIAGTGLLPLIGLALVRAWRSGPHPPVLLLLLAAAGYFVAAVWVSFAFVGARLLFLLPFYYLFLVRGIDPRRLSGLVLYVGLIGIAAGGLWSYYRKQDFLNKGYLVNFEQIGREVLERTGAESTYVLLDRFSTSAGYSLHGPAVTYLKILDSDGARREALEHIEQDRPPRVWFIRYARHAGVHREVEARLAGAYEAQRHGYVPYSALDRQAMRLAGFRERPSHVMEVLEFRRRPVSR
jgi:hypothetical protein